MAKHCQEDPLAQCVDPLQDMLLKALQCSACLQDFPNLECSLCPRGFHSRCVSGFSAGEPFESLDCQAPRCEVPSRDVDDKASRRDVRDHYDENWVVDKPPRSWSECLWEPSLVPSGWVVTGSAYPLAQRSEWAGGEEAQPHSPDTLVLAMQAKKKNMLQSNQGSGSPF